MKWRFDPARDGPHTPGHSRTSWINIDKPGLGSMRVTHETIDHATILERMRLIAAAPELLAALERMRQGPTNDDHARSESDESYDPWKFIREQADAAIAKAKAAS